MPFFRFATSPPLGGAGGLLVEMQGVAHALLLGAEIALIVAVWLDFDRHVLHDFKAVSIKANSLSRVVGDETEFGDVEVTENLCSHAIVTKVRVKTEMDVGINGVHALFLKNVSCYLGCKTYATTFLLQVNNSTFTFLLDEFH